eukprot:TRINITY_DN74403_c0_g1_i1.p1 TRINITY_DN74403_c0_g1~~TRINITY_DN74403_c0_g1_i1.p1  ORF type:complete len:568 (-),score=99.51 TRINITY_DN74403_c0_g1_i1:265-1968(-)
MAHLGGEETAALVGENQEDEEGYGEEGDEQAWEEEEPEEAEGGLGPADQMLGNVRTMVAMGQFNEQQKDYTNSLEELDPGSVEYQAALDACHERGAKRCVMVANTQRGIYVKAAQFMASIQGGAGDQGIPPQYIEALKVFTDKAPGKSMSEMVAVLKEDLPQLGFGSWPEGELPKDSMFVSFEIEPMASASLAQVHRAVLKDGSAVAVKMQYPTLRSEMASDFAALRTMGEHIEKLSGGFKLMWIVEDFERYLTGELDFEAEARNAQATATALAHRCQAVMVPTAIEHLCSKRVLIMEFCDSLLRIDNPQGLRDAGLDPEECAVLLCDTFAELIFVHGRVHGDPHAGNVYFRALEDGSARRRPQLVILDHGLYHDLSERDVRSNFCKYWIACCDGDVSTMTTIGEIFAGALARFLPLMLSPWFALSGGDVSFADMAAAAAGRLPDTIGMREILDFVTATREGGANMVGLLHSLGYIRGLLNGLGLSEDKRLSSMLSYAMMGNAVSSDKNFASASSPGNCLTLSQRSWIKYRMWCMKMRIQAAQLYGPFVQRCMCASGQTKKRSRSES